MIKQDIQIDPDFCALTAEIAQIDMYLPGFAGIGKDLGTPLLPML
jgi:hypothetical protein